MLNQLSFKFNPAKNSQSEPLFLEENEKAVHFLQKFFAQNQDLNHQESFANRGIILGEEKSGKSSLVKHFGDEKNADFLEVGNLKKEELTKVFLPNKFYILENIDEIEDEDLLFHILNSSLENQAFLLMSAKNISHFNLKDLVSRIKNILQVSIENPQNEESVKMLILKSLSDLQLKLSGEIINFLARNLPRNYKEIFRATKKIEEFCFANKRKPSLKEARALLGLD